MAGADGGWAGHVLVCGLPGLGLRIVEQLHLSGVPVVVVDDRPDDRSVRMVAAWGIPHLVGNPRRRETLLEAGLDRARAVVCVESDDLASLETALLVHRLRPEVRLVTRLRNAAGSSSRRGAAPGSSPTTSPTSSGPTRSCSRCCGATPRHRPVSPDRPAPHGVPAPPPPSGR
jgi:hypothetical protein